MARILLFAVIVLMGVFPGTTAEKLTPANGAAEWINLSGQTMSDVSSPNVTCSVDEHFRIIHEEIPQVRDWWCWAATMAIIAHYYGVDVSQLDIMHEPVLPGTDGFESKFQMCHAGNSVCDTCNEECWGTCWGANDTEVSAAWTQLSICYGPDVLPENCQDGAEAADEPLPWETLVTVIADQSDGRNGKLIQGARGDPASPQYQHYVVIDGYGHLQVTGEDDTCIQLVEFWDPFPMTCHKIEAADGTVDCVESATGGERKLVPYTAAADGDNGGNPNLFEQEYWLQWQAMFYNFEQW